MRWSRMSHTAQAAKQFRAFLNCFTAQVYSGCEDQLIPGSGKARWHLPSRLAPRSVAFAGSPALPAVSR